VASEVDTLRLGAMCGPREARGELFLKSLDASIDRIIGAMEQQSLAAELAQMRLRAMSGPLGSERIPFHLQFKVKFRLGSRAMDKILVQIV